MAQQDSKPHIIVNKQLEGIVGQTPGFGMWCGICLKCFEQWDYWAFGATLGAGLEHMRRCR